MDESCLPKVYVRLRLNVIFCIPAVSHKGYNWLLLRPFFLVVHLLL